MKSKDRLDYLLSGHCDSSLSEPEARELNKRLNESTAARRRYLSFMELHAEFSITAEALPAQHAATIKKKARKPIPIQWIFAASAAAAALFFGIMWPTADPVISPTHATHKPPITTSPAARISATLNPRWRTELQKNHQVLPLGERHQLTSGIIEVAHQKADLVLEAPCVFQLHDTGIRLLYGRVLARVHPDVNDFRVDTPHGSFLDVGTTFGLDARIRSANCHVYDGAVFVHPSDSPSPTNLELSKATLVAGQSAHFSKGKLSSLQGIREADRVHFATAIPRKDGIRLLRGQMRIAKQTPKHRADWLTSHMLIIPEEQRALSKNLPVSIKRPGLYNRDFKADDGKNTIIPKGTKVRSFLVHFGAPVDNQVHDRLASVVFDGPVLGIACSSLTIEASESEFGKIQTDADLHPGRRGLEPEDVIILDEDRRTVTIGLQAWYVDYIRIFVAVP